MKKLLNLLLLVMMMALVFGGSAEAKWWIFGQSQDEITVKYLYLNGVSFDEGGQKVMLVKDMLPNGLIDIKGKASAGTAKIGAVQISTDNKVKWEKAKLDKDGTFDYTFTPQPDKTYDIFVKIMDTRGKTNDIESTYKQVTISAGSLRDMVKVDLDGLIDAYQTENAPKFDSFIGDDFAADKSILDRAIRKDFSAFDKISMRYTINNITTNAKGDISVSLTFSRTVTSSRSGQTLSDTGMTEFIFRLSDTGPKVYSMKAPLLFGLSDTTNIATGNVSVGNSNVISVSDAGEVSTGLGSSTGIASAGSMTTMTYNNTVWPWTLQSFSFDLGTKTTEAWSVYQSAMTGDFGIYGDNHHLLTKTGVGFIDLGVKGLASVTSVPTTGYGTSNGTAHVVAGHSYAFQLAGGAYGVIEIISTSIPVTTLRYKYSDSGANFN
jgi:hypothetical protein